MFVNRKKMEFDNSVESKIIQTLEELKAKASILHDKEVIDDFLKDVKDSFVKDSHRVSGGMIPVCVDPNTLESYFLFGVEKIRETGCFAPLDFVYQEPGGPLQIRNTTCPFQGWIDPYETFSQGAARECWEESKGTFSDQVDGWRCLINKEFSKVIPSMDFLGLVSLGFLDQTARTNLENKFLSMECLTKGMTETHQIKFLSIKRLHEIMQVMSLKSIFFQNREYCNMSKVEPSLQPDYAFILRRFMIPYFLQKLPIEGPAEKIFYPELLPSTITLPFHKKHLFKLSPISEKVCQDGTSCLLCNRIFQTNELTYSCAEHKCSHSFIHFHPKCVFEETNEGWKPISTSRQMYPRNQLTFFQNEVIQFLMNLPSIASSTSPASPFSPSYPVNELLSKNQIFPGWKSISDLPPITPETRELILSLFRLRENYLPPEPTYIQKNCGHCGRIFFQKESRDYPHCRPCSTLVKFIERRQDMLDDD